MGKRIEDLPAYGSFNSDKMKADIFEVSKNSGTSGSPVYAADGSRQIKLSQLSSLIGALLPGGYIPLLGPNYIVVSLGTRLENGEALLACIEYAKAAEPDGHDLSASNRFAVILFPGIYDLDAAGIPALGEFVDLIGIGNAEDIIITSEDALGTIQIANTNDYILQNLTIKNSAGGGSITHGVLQTDHGVWKNLILYDQNTQNTTFAGEYSHIDAKSDLILNGPIDGTVRNSDFQDFSCGYSNDIDVTIFGSIEDNTGGNSCFGVGPNVTISGTLRDLTGGDSCFGCTSAFGEFSGGLVEFASDALVENCIGADDCFGRCDGGVIINCKFISCDGGNRSFGCSLYGNCTFNSLAYFELCNSKLKSFCFAASAMENNGKCFNCIGTTQCFGSTSATGKLTHCTRTGGLGTHAGTIENCVFSENSGAVEALLIAEGAIITKSRVTQAGAGDCISGGVVNAEISYCYMNKELIGITNTIEQAFNIGDGFIPTFFILTSPNGHRQKITVDDTSTIAAEDLGF